MACHTLHVSEHGGIERLTFAVESQQEHATHPRGRHTACSHSFCFSYQAAKLLIYLDLDEEVL